MPHARFVVTEINQEEGYGRVRVIEPDHLNPDTGQLIRFDTTRATEIMFTGGSATGYRIPTNLFVTERTPAVGDELYGSMAYQNEPWQVATGPDGNPFLRNWGYADQPDFGPYEDMDYDDLDVYDDEPDDDPYDPYEEDDEDPLAGDIDDGRHYVPEPSPLTTLHYFPLKARGYI